MKAKNSKHIGIYVHHRGEGHWDKIKALLPHISCKVTLLSSLDLRSAKNEQIDYVWLPRPITEKDEGQVNDLKTHQERMNALFEFVYKKAPDLLYIDECVDIATVANLIGVPYVFTRQKESPVSDFGLRLAYERSIFNIAHYVNEQEDEDFKNSPFYQKTKYHLRERSELNDKLVSMYLENMAAS